METRFAKIAEIVSKHPEGKLTTLTHYINEATLEESYYKLKGNKASGVDKVTKEQYGDKLSENLADLVGRMKKQAYKPQPVRRVYIPKDGTNKMRPLGIPAFEDKIVQEVISGILTEVYEPIFLENSFGFRPGRSCHDALRMLNAIIIKQKVSSRQNHEPISYHHAQKSVF